MFILPGILFGIQLSTAYHARHLCYLALCIAHASADRVYGITMYLYFVFPSKGDGSRKLYRLGLRGEIFHMVKVYDTCIGCTQCVRACPTDVLEMAKMASNKAGAVATSPRTEDCVGCKRCESACPTDYLSVRVYLRGETTRSMGLGY